MYAFKFEVGDIVADCFERREILRKCIDADTGLAYYVSRRIHSSNLVLWDRADDFDNFYVLDWW